MQPFKFLYKLTPYITNHCFYYDICTNFGSMENFDHKINFYGILLDYVITLLLLSQYFHKYKKKLKL